MKLEAEIANALRRQTAAVLGALARENREATLEGFRTLLLPKIVETVRAEHPDVPLAAVVAMVAASVTVVANRLTINFDLLARHILDPDGTADTDPRELAPDTERP